MHEPTPEQYNPPLTWRSHAWRTTLALAVSAVLWPATAKLQWEQARPLFWVDLLVGVLCFVLVFFRRRWPLPVAAVTAVLGAVSVSSAGAGMLASVSFATRRHVAQIIAVGLLGLLGAVVYPMIGPSPDHDPWWITFAFGLAFTVAMLVWGMYLGSRRELLWTLRDRAERAEAEQELRVAQGRANERARIAREMHDVLAHRISLITMHAGALAYRTDLSADEMRGTAELIQTKSHEALADLRQVLGVLRSDGELPQDRPQPTFCDLRELVHEAEESGMHVQYVEEVRDAPAMPEQVGRTTYRIVQEGLTNARKHAPGVTVLVRVAGSAEEGVDISIRNPARTAGTNGSATPGAGLGLVGLNERAKLAGGRLDASRDGGTFELHGWLPWTP
ncbi:MAG: histidine kinase [Nocardioidaceae bacterium]|nr:histidine kinase [Nocardioidaceae bacterium]NUS50745.1 histidine kinase [Nocardioidaceae bacterium]